MAPPRVMSMETFIMRLNTDIPSVDLKDSHLNWKQFSKAFLNATPNCIAVTDLSFKTITSNTIAQKHLDIFPGTLIGTTIPEIEKEGCHVLKYVETIKNIEITRKNRNFITRVSPISWGKNLLGILYIFQDKTELDDISKKMESYQELSIELHTIIDSSNDGLFICDGNGKILRVNPASETMNGIVSSEVVGKYIKELVDEGTIDRSVTMKVLESGKTETIVQYNKKTNKNLLLTGTPVFRNEGHLFRIVTNERDITEITRLKVAFEEQAALKDRYETDLLEMQLDNIESKKIIAESENIKKIMHKALKLGKVDSAVLLLGESGTGKGITAELIHKYSKRRAKPMIKVNCGVIPSSLLESELFGYKKGAFTGADTGKPGRFEMADKGILFLDEIAEMPLSSQVKLLQFLEDGGFTRIGDTVNRKVDVRIIAATNKNLEEMVANNEFRKDLYYRLKVIPIKLPPLRERKDCIVPMLDHYIKHFSKKHGIGPTASFSREALDVLENYDYPGNARELINMCERLIVMNENRSISLPDLPDSVLHNSGKNVKSGGIWQKGRSYHDIMNDMEKELLIEVMNDCKTQAEAARALKINQSTIARKLSRHNFSNFGRHQVKLWNVEESANKEE